jgi:hypothetical protein
MKHQRIAIIGAGTGGLSAATLLARQGHAVTVIERARQLTTVGAGIMLQPSGIGALRELGCLEHMQQYGHRIEALYGQIKSGKTIMQVKYADLNAGQQLFGLGVHRASLCHVLDTALSVVPHQRWFGCEVSHIEESDHETVVTFLQDGQAHREVFDAILVANGSASQLRPRSLVRYDRQYPWGAMWLIRPLTVDLSSLDKPYLQQRYDGSSVMLGALPTGYVPNDPSTRMMSMFWSLPVSEMPHWQSEHFDLASWKTRALDLWPDLSPLINNIRHQSELLPATYRDVIMSRWGAGRIGVIGDAAHAMSPQLGQGANMALLDASAIASAVAASNEWENVWEQFHASRNGSIRFYQGMSRLLTPLFQSNIPGAGFLRDIAFPLAHLLPWLRRQMTETVTGTKQKWI